MFTGEAEISTTFHRVRSETGIYCFLYDYEDFCLKNPRMSWSIPLSGQSSPRKKNNDSTWFPPDFQKKATHELVTIATCSMYGIFTYIWLKVMVNVGKYTIHRVYGYSHLSKRFIQNVPTWMSRWKC